MMFRCLILGCDCAKQDGELAIKTRHIRNASVYIAKMEQIGRAMGPLSLVAAEQCQTIWKLRLALTNLVRDVRANVPQELPSMHDAELVLS